MLSSHVLRLAHENPSLRTQLLPLVRTADFSKKDFESFVKGVKYYPVDVGDSSQKKSLGYVSDEESKAGKATFEKKLEDRKKWLDKYQEAMKARSGQFYEGLLEHRSHSQLEEFVKTEAENIKQADGAKSLADVQALFTPGDLPAYSTKFGPLLLNTKDSFNPSKDAFWRGFLISRIEKSGDPKDQALFVATGAILTDKPDFGKGGTDALKAAKLLSDKYKKAREDALKAAEETFAKAVKDAQDAVKKKYGDVDFAKVTALIPAPVLMGR